MVVVGFVAYNRSAVNCMLNSVLSHGGVQEVRIMEMGDGDHFSKLVLEQRMLHQFAAIYSCSIHELISREGVFPEVLIVLTGSQKNLVEHNKFSKALATLIVDDILLTKPASMKFIFGDNTRGLIQQAFFQQALKKAGLDLNAFQSVVLSSIYQMSKSLNSLEGGKFFRCYPKSDGSIHVYDPSTRLTMTEIKTLRDELKLKLDGMNQLFEKNNSDVYPNVEGTVVARYLNLYIQNGDWDESLRDEELHSRTPSTQEKKYYGIEGIEGNVSFFLPVVGVEPEYLPEYMRTHVKNICDLVSSSVTDIGE